MESDIIIRLFNGFNSKEEFELKDGWGEEQITIGAFSGIIWTYGTMTLFVDGEEVGRLNINNEEAYVYYRGIYFGDFEIISLDNWDGAIYDEVIKSELL